VSKRARIERWLLQGSKWQEQRWGRIFAFGSELLLGAWASVNA